MGRRRLEVGSQPVGAEIGAHYDSCWLLDPTYVFLTALGCENTAGARAPALISKMVHLGRGGVSSGRSAYKQHHPQSAEWLIHHPRSLRRLMVAVFCAQHLLLVRARRTENPTERTLQRDMPAVALLLLQHERRTNGGIGAVRECSCVPNVQQGGLSAALGEERSL